jgi:small subunit ribosomal protein S3
VGQKVHPYGFRLGINRGWHSNWIAKRDYAELLHEDLKLKKELKGRFTGAGVSHIDVERAANKLKIIIHTSRPGIIIGRKGAEIDKLKGEIKERTGREVYVNIQEIHKPEPSRSPSNSRSESLSGERCDEPSRTRNASGPRGSRSGCPAG